MSKSIYDEALKKIDLNFSVWDRNQYWSTLDLVEKALEQAQNQEKLLNLNKNRGQLYKNRGQLLKKLHYSELLSVDEHDEIEIDIEKIERIIKELESNGKK